VGGFADLTHSARSQGSTQATARDMTFRVVRLVSGDGATTDTFYEGEGIRVELRIDVHTSIKVVEVVCRVRHSGGYLIFTMVTGKRWVQFEPGTYATHCVIEPNYLRPGWYSLELSLVTGAAVAQDVVPEAIAFNIIGKVAEDDNPRYAGREDMGVIRIEYPWDDFRRLESPKC
jgi:hypothetical protein